MDQGILVIFYIGPTRIHVWYLECSSFHVYRLKGKGKGLPRTSLEAPEGYQMYSSNFPSTSALDGGWVANATPRPLYPRERPGTHCTGGWVGPRAGLDGCEISRPPPEFDPRTVQLVASRYTD